jgi:hypothetical protein
LLDKDTRLRNSLFDERFDFVVRAIPTILLNTIHPFMEAIQDSLSCFGCYTTADNFSHSLFERSGMLAKIG